LRFFLSFLGAATDLSRFIKIYQSKETETEMTKAQFMAVLRNEVLITSKTFNPNLTCF